jgi:hypothetical protein
VSQEVPDDPGAIKGPGIEVWVGTGDFWDWRRVVLGAAYQQKTDQNGMTRESGFFGAGSTPCMNIS